MYKLKSFHLHALSEGEEVIAVVHRNWFYVFTQYVALIAISAVLIAAFVMLPKLFPIFTQVQIAKLLVFFESSCALALWIFAFLIWIDYYFDVWVVTTERIVNIEQKGMFSRTISELSYGKIQDVTTEVIGFLPSMLNYGNVYVQTAAETERFMFRTVSDPYTIKNIITAQQEKNASSGKPF